MLGRAEHPVRVPSMLDSLEVKVLFQSDSDEGIAKHKGVTARWGLKEVWSKAAT